MHAKLIKHPWVPTLARVLVCAMFRGQFFLFLTGIFTSPVVQKSNNRFCVHTCQDVLYCVHILCRTYISYRLINFHFRALKFKWELWHMCVHISIIALHNTDNLCVCVKYSHRAGLFVLCCLSLKQAVDVSMMIHQWHCCSSRCVHWVSCDLSSQQGEEQGEGERMLSMEEEWTLPLHILDHLPTVCIITALTIHSIKGPIKEARE